jgi:cation:H+ antiporter
LDLLTLVLFVAGLGLLVLGAEALVRGASRLAAALGVSPLVIGLTVVAYGTGAPEIAVTVQAGFTGRPDIGLGNVVGSNVFNVLAVLGVSAMIVPLVVTRRLVRLEVLVMIGVSFLLLLLALDGSLGRFDGGLLLGGAVAYGIFAFVRGRVDAAPPGEARQEDPPLPAAERKPRRVPLQVALILAGLVLLVLGSRWLVDGAVAIAGAVGLSELVIGLTVVAVGTGLPEAATSVVAALRGERDIAVGNIVGSNIFNVLAVLGLAGLVSPGGLAVSPAALGFDIPVMIAVALACLPIFYTGHMIARWEGALFFGYYVVYVAYLVLRATDHDALAGFELVMLAFVLPITAVTLGVLAVRARRASRARRG